ncbi:MAG TPA: hypothetical protein VKE51_13910 [Vicinamibacterales bacterium]|nr:hypothetical protein [Vicinamibacterales bacterium]
MICVGSFSKTLFPALRLGFLIVPSDLQRRLVSARRDADVHPPLLEQAALADLMSEGHPIATCGACAPHTASDWTHEHGTVRYLPQPFSQNRPPALTISSEFSRVCHRASAARQT